MKIAAVALLVSLNNGAALLCLVLDEGRVMMRAETVRERLNFALRLCRLDCSILTTTELFIGFQQQRLLSSSPSCQERSCRLHPARAGRSF